MISTSFTGYEFPDILEDWDANWLNVRVRIDAEEKSWNIVTACFLTTDVQALRRWFEAIAVNGSLDDGDTFATLEPDISFEYRGTSEEQHHLAINLKFGPIPDWIARDHSVLSVSLTETDLASAIDYLTEVESQLPPRGDFD